MTEKKPRSFANQNVMMLPQENLLGATLNGTNVQKYTVQFQYTGEGPMDVKQEPVETPKDLPSKLKAYEGQVITVKNGEIIGVDSKGEKIYGGRTIDYIFSEGEWIPYEAYITKIDGGEF